MKLYLCMKMYVYMISTDGSFTMKFTLVLHISFFCVINVPLLAFYPVFMVQKYLILSEQNILNWVFSMTGKENVDVFWGEGDG